MLLDKNFAKYKVSFLRSNKVMLLMNALQDFGMKNPKPSPGPTLMVFGVPVINCGHS